jgi:hypothetical protein
MLQITAGTDKEFVRYWCSSIAGCIRSKGPAVSSPVHEGGETNSFASRVMGHVGFGFAAGVGFAAVAMPRRRGVLYTQRRCHRMR